VSVTKRGDRWLARWVIDGRHVGRTFDRKVDAVAWEAEARRRAQLGAHAPAEPSRETLEEWLDGYWERESPRWAQSTRLYKAHLLDKWIEPYIGRVRLKDLGTARVREWLAEIAAAGCTPGQRNHAQRTLSAALGVAVRDGVLPSNPCAAVRRAPHKAARPQALTPLEIERIRAEMPSPRDALMVSLMGYAGLRPEELVALRWSDIGSRVIVIDRAFTYGELKTTKTGARRAVEIVPPLALDIAEARPDVVGEDDLVAPSQVDSFLNWNNWRNRVWDPAVVAAGFFRETTKQGRLVKVRTVAPYDLRHSYASLLIHEGRNPLLVAAAMGHSSGQLIWSTYGHVFEDARLAPATPMVEAIDAARQELHRSCTAPRERQLRLVLDTDEKPRIPGKRRERETGLEPATLSLEG
jgi:integrase